jgi:hypothetical protein
MIIIIAKINSDVWLKQWVYYSQNKVCGKILLRRLILLPQRERKAMFLATFLFMSLLVLVVFKYNQKKVEQYVPIRIDDEIRKQKRKQW